MTGQQLVRQAMRTLRRYGWVKGHVGNTYDGFCIVGAVQHNSNHRGPEVCQAYHIINTYIRFHHGCADSIPQWNDEIATQADIEAMINHFDPPPQPVAEWHTGQMVTRISDRAHDYTVA